MKGREFYATVEALTVPIALAAAFPYCAIGFSADRKPRTAEDFGASVVFLEEKAEAEAERLAKGGARDSRGSGLHYIELLGAVLPDAKEPPVMPLGARSRPSALRIVERATPPFLPSRRALPPSRIRSEAEAEPLPFPKSELLKVN